MQCLLTWPSSSSLNLSPLNKRKSWVPSLCLGEGQSGHGSVSYRNVRKSYNHRVIILNRGSMFAFQWREFSPSLSSAHRLLQYYHSQWEIGDAAIPGEFPLSLPPLGPLANERSVSSDVTLWRCTFWSGKFCISFLLFYCEGMLSPVVLWLCGCRSEPSELTSFEDKCCHFYWGDVK